MARVAIEAHPRAYISYYLMASYLYYVHDVPLLSDGMFDEICRYLLDHFDEIEHEHSHLIDPSMFTAGTGYSLEFQRFPTRTIAAAVTLADDLLGANIGPVSRS